MLLRVADIQSEHIHKIHKVVMVKRRRAGSLVKMPNIITGILVDLIVGIYSQKDLHMWST